MVAEDVAEAVAEDVVEDVEDRLKVKESIMLHYNNKVIISLLNSINY